MKIAEKSKREFKYLVRELKIMKGDYCKVFPLHYIHLLGKTLDLFPFDQERAGYEYRDKIILRQDADGNYVMTDEKV